MVKVPLQLAVQIYTAQNLNQLAEVTGNTTGDLFYAIEEYRQWRDLPLPEDPQMKVDVILKNGDCYRDLPSHFVSPEKIRIWRYALDYRRAT